MKLVISLLLFWGCTQSSGLKSYANKGINIRTDTLMHYVKTEFKVIDIKKENDTLFIISTNKVLFYPFGKYSNFNEFKVYYIERLGLKLEIDSAFNVFKIFKLQNNISSIELIENTETGKLEIFTADINDSSFELYYGIKIGMTKNDILSKFFNNIPEELSNIATIKLESGLEGVWHYYSFSSKNLLEKIAIKSDYDLK